MAQALTLTDMALALPLTDQAMPCPAMTGRAAASAQWQPGPYGKNRVCMTVWQAILYAAC